MKAAKTLKRLRKQTARVFPWQPEPRKGGCNDRSTMSERPLNDFLAEVSERSDVRWVCHCPWEPMRWTKE